jgi:hypothetical protein
MEEINQNIYALNGTAAPEPVEEDVQEPEEPTEDYNVYGKTEYSNDASTDELDDGDDFDDDFLDD